MKPYKIVDTESWRKAHLALLVKEKEMTRALDDLAAFRRQQPACEVTKAYRFHGPDGECALLDLFDGRSQLIVYHHMLKPNDSSPCSGCSMFADNVGHIAHLHARDTSLVMVSRAGVSEIERFRRRMGWDIPWFSTQDNFNADFDVTEGFGVNIFLRDDDKVYRTYFTSARGIEELGSTWTFLDRTPLGRQEIWENSPENVPQTKAYQWWRLHDEY